MNKAQSAISTMVLIAGIVNAGEAVKKGKNITYAVMGGFVVLVLLLALAEGERKVAEMFAGAYLITCLALNGTDLFSGVSAALSSGKRFDPGPAGGGTTSTTQTSTTTKPATPTVKSV